MSEFLNKMKNYFDKGVEVSKETLSKAGEKAQDLGEKGVLKIEIMQLESKVGKEIFSLGEKVYELLALDGETSVAASDDQISGIIHEISRLKKEIDSKTGDMKSDKIVPSADEDGAEEKAFTDKTGNE